MPLAPQEVRTFFVTAVAHERRPIFQTERMATLLVGVLSTNRSQSRFRLHAFVIMPNHVHVLFTPAFDIPLERSVQFIKGGFSFRARRELDFWRAVWQAGYTEHRITDRKDFEDHLRYIHQNPVRAKLVSLADEFPFSSASRSDLVDPMPRHFQG
jgi:putative transposase